MSQKQFEPLHGKPSPPSLEERWEAVRSQVRKHWPQITKDEMAMIDGDSRKLVALVHQKTGADLSDIEAQIDEIAASSEGLLGRVTRTVQEAASSAAHQVSEPVAQAYQVVHEQITASPGRAACVAFTTGLMLGLGMASLVKDLVAPRRSSMFGRW